MTDTDPCPKHTPCSNWPSRLDVQGPDQFLELVNELKASAECGELDILHASHSFDAVKHDGQWASDFFKRRVRCRTSGKCFELGADTYHERAVWAEIDPAPRHEERVQALLLSLALGDSLGLPYEGLGPQAIARRRGGKPLRHSLLFRRGLLSDDTEHAIMTLLAFQIAGGDSAKFARSLARRMRLWFICIPPGIGMATAKACLKLWLGFPSSRSGVRSAGNGPCMRAPILGVLIPDDDLRCQFVDASSRLTHTDPRAIESARFIAALAAANTSACPLKPDVVRAIADRELTQPDLHTEVVKSIDIATRGGRIADLGYTRGPSGFVLHTVPAVTIAVLANPTDPMTAIEDCIRAGGDTDSTAAIAAAICGAAIRPDALPQDLLYGIIDFPISRKYLARLTTDLAMRDAQEKRNILHLLRWIVMPLRNLIMLIVVLVHGFRRLTRL